MPETRAVETVPSDFYDLLAAKTLLSVATLGPDGEPQNNPVWFIWDGAALQFAVQPQVQKLKNLRRDDRIAASIFDPANPGRYLEFRGTVTIAPDTDDLFGDALARKYLGADHLPWSTPGNGRQVLTIHPTRIIARG
jgi:PPOX class probable F420-dependent enzyme